MTPIPERLADDERAQLIYALTSLQRAAHYLRLSKYKTQAEWDRLGRADNLARRTLEATAERERAA